MPSLRLMHERGNESCKHMAVALFIKYSDGRSYVDFESRAQNAGGKTGVWDPD
jgi:hypothetical protein